MDVSSKEQVKQTTDNADSGFDDQLDEWMLAGGSACPQAKALRQRAKYFKNVRFSGLKRLLDQAAKTEFF